MHALIVVDAQNEFSPHGLRAVSNHDSALACITRWVAHARANDWPIAWVQHYNKPDESRAFVPGTWGAELSSELNACPSEGLEALFEKNVYGAFTDTGLEEWLCSHEVTRVIMVGFFAHMCLSTSVREAIIRGFEVTVDPDGTGARQIEHPTLGMQSARDVCRSTLLHLADMGATIASISDRPAGVHPLRIQR